MGTEFARGICAYSDADAARILGRRSAEIESLLGFRGRDEMIHRDDLAHSGALAPGADRRSFRQRREWPQTETASRGDRSSCTSLGSNAVARGEHAGPCEHRPPRTRRSPLPPPRSASAARRSSPPNALDLAAARAQGIGAPLLDRLRLDATRIEAMAHALDEIVALPDPIGVVSRRMAPPERPSDPARASCRSVSSA